MRNIIFDLDGTILDSEKLYFEILRKVAKAFNVILTNEQYNDFYSMVLADKAKKLVDKYYANGSVDDIIKKYRSIELNETEKYGKRLLFPDTVETLSQLKDRGYRLYLCTNSRTAHVLDLLRISGIDDYFEGMVCREMCDKFKPDPQPYQKVIDIYHLNKEETCAVEDTSHGVQSAKMAGLFTFGIKRDYPIDDKYTDICICQLNELVEIIDGI